jgi:N-acetylglucosaminyldiphosphoundecaprenol N-acetyl-beta-D-mannosaminyltransferase
MADAARARFLGIETDVVTKQELIDFVLQAIDEDRRVVIGNHNLHSIYLFHRHSRFREFYAIADRIFVDGMGAIALGRLYGARVGRRHRITFLDFEADLFSALGERGSRVYCLGARPGVPEKALAVFRARYPGLTISAHDGYFDVAAGSSENEAILAEIAGIRPHVLMVGMGMPRQEQWIAENYTRLQANVTMSLGGFMDFYGGGISVPPRWLGPVGLEWAYLFLVAPRRGARRYLLEPWSVGWQMAHDLLRQARRRKAGSSHAP